MVCLVELIRKEKQREQDSPLAGRPNNEGILITEIRKDRLRKKYQRTQAKTQENQTVNQSTNPLFPYWSMFSGIFNLNPTKPKKDVSLLEEIRKSQGTKKLYNIASVPVQPPVYDSTLIGKLKDHVMTRTYEPDDKLSVGDIGGKYQLLVTERCVDNPFIIDAELVKVIKKHTRDCATDYDKARAIFDWMDDNIRYGDGKRYVYRYRNSEEVLKTKEGVCGEMAYLYITMARSIGLTANYVSVSRDCWNKSVHHGCAHVETDRGGIFVDVAYQTFDINHRRYRIISDQEAIQNFKEWRH